MNTLRIGSKIVLSIFFMFFEFNSDPKILLPIKSCFLLPYLAAVILSVFRATENIRHVGDIFFPV